MRFDVIIIGGGAAGISAALWCDDLKLNALLLEKSAEFGGQLLWTHNAIANHLGANARNGREMRDIFVRQIENRRFETRFNAEVTAIDFADKIISTAHGETFSAANLIIATGVRRRKLNIGGEEQFVGRGILESGKREAETVRDKRVVIIGGGDAALENASILAAAAAEVILIHRGEKFRARREFVEAARNNPKVEILTATTVEKISGGERIESVELKNTTTGEIFSLAADYVLRRIGVAPNTEFLGGAIDSDADGYIKINGHCETNLRGIYAVGDVANPLSPTVSTAIGTGAAAVKAIANFGLQMPD